KELKLLGSHNYQNILAALAVAKLQGWQLDKCLQVIKNFTGLEHRCQWIAEKQGVIYINDSKATNPAAACSSLLSMSEIYKGTIHIILGGSSKNAKFTELVDAIEKNEVSSYLIGEEGQTIYDALPSSVNKEICKDLPTAIKVISGKAQKGDVVLLSPACASFDSYASFSARGQHFIEEVQLI
ncbi:MAG: UDP-N-acetylmuramoyl-L-alanine--D-glutamate ligase, partial [Candidatus Portiera sp.]|nr:UDP-N-acetylmuramoyl-L-alanine--D-glutamate ligase [Portiera sp.]